MPHQITVPTVRARKGAAPGSAGEPDARPLVMVTAYDAPTGRIADEAGVDIILVGDSLAMVVLGYEDTLQVTMDDMVRHTAAVARVRPRALVVADLPWLSYHLDAAGTVHNAARLVRAGARAVKLEGGRKRLPAVAALAEAEIPVMGHVGLTPQSLHAMGGFKVQGKDLATALTLVDDAVALAEAGCFAVVVEGVPDGVARRITEALPVPTIGIGAGPWCDGQVLVLHDLLGLHDGIAGRFVRRYAHLKADAVAAVAAYAADVRGRRFPSEDESYHLSPEAAQELALRPTPEEGHSGGSERGSRTA